VPVSLKVFLTALAIADDLVAILVVALFYGGSINLGLLGIAVLVILLIQFLKRIGEKRMFPYIALAIVVWTLFYYSGIHSTMSGVVMAFLIPSAPRYNRAYYARKKADYMRRLLEYDVIEDGSDFPNGPQRHCLRRMSSISLGAMGMGNRVEHALNPWVNFLIMPVFALANAGVEITDVSYFNILQYSPELGSVSMGIFLGLVLGKPIGITLASLVAIKAKVADMPANASWKMFFAVACLGGIGFTMSIFVDTLSFGDQPQDAMMHMRDAGKIAVLLGSIAAGVFGSILINFVHRLEKRSSCQARG